MPYFALGGDSVGDLGTVLAVLNLIALTVFAITLSADAIGRGVDRMLHALHRPHRLPCSPRRR